MRKGVFRVKSIGSRIHREHWKYLIKAHSEFMAINFFDNCYKVSRIFHQIIFFCHAIELFV